jgi:hypothetical protein
MRVTMSTRRLDCLRQLLPGLRCLGRDVTASAASRAASESVIDCNHTITICKMKSMVVETIGAIRKNF